MNDVRQRTPHMLHGAAGAAIGATIAVIVVLIIDHFKSASDNLLWLPAGIVLGLVAGGIIGLLLTEETIGGREDKAADNEAREKIGEAPAPRRSNPSDDARA